MAKKRRAPRARTSARRGKKTTGRVRKQPARRVARGSSGASRTRRKAGRGSARKASPRMVKLVIETHQQPTLADMLPAKKAPLPRIAKF